jgi:26S proteasome regulatory subunit N5
MDRKEKVEMILEQMRLCLATKDYIRAQIISKKISIRFFTNTEHQDLKLKFYRYMIEMDEHDNSYLNICRHYRAIFDTPKIQENEREKLQTLKNVSLFIVLSPFDNHQSDLIARILEEKALADIPKYKSLMEQFTNQVQFCSLYCSLQQNIHDATLQTTIVAKM